MTNGARMHDSLEQQAEARVKAGPFPSPSRKLAARLGLSWLLAWAGAAGAPWLQQRIFIYSAHGCGGLQPTAAQLVTP